MSGYAGDVDALRTRIPCHVVAKPTRAKGDARLRRMKVGTAAVVGAGMNDQCVAGLHVEGKKPHRRIVTPGFEVDVLQAIVRAAEDLCVVSVRPR